MSESLKLLNVFNRIIKLLNLFSKYHVKMWYVQKCCRKLNVTIGIVPKQILHHLVRKPPKLLIHYTLLLNIFRKAEFLEKE